MRVITMTDHDHIIYVIRALTEKFGNEYSFELNEELRGRYKEYDITAALKKAGSDEYAKTPAMVLPIYAEAYTKGLIDGKLGCIF